MITFVCSSGANRIIQPRCTASPASSRDPAKTPRRPRACPEGLRQAAVILMRHGQTDWNHAGRVQGGLDRSRLNDHGMRQARLAGRWLRNVELDSVFCSPLTRARDTLRLATDASGNKSLQAKKPEVLDALKEIQVPWQGLQRKEIPHSFFSKAYVQYARNPPRFSYNGFSPLLDIIRRAKEVWKVVVRSRGSCHLLVSHNQMNKALICAALGLPTVLSAWRQGNCCFNVLMLEEGKSPRLRLCNGGHHEVDIYSASKVPIRRGCMRVILHRQGEWQGLKHMIEGKEISHFYIIGDTPQHDLEQLGVDCMDARCEKVPFSAASNSAVYESAAQILNDLRAVYEDKFVVVTIQDSLIYRAFFAASIGLGKDGLQKLASDVGGVSILDIKVSDPVGKAVTFVEGYNIGAWLTRDALVSYTSH